MEELGAPVECFDNYSGTFVTDPSTNSIGGTGVDGGGGGGGGGGGDGAGAGDGTSNEAASSVEHGVARLRAVRNMRRDLPPAQRWTPSVVMCGTKGAAVVSTLFVRDSRPNGLGWTPIACTTVRLAPSESAEGGDALLVDAQGPLPHGITYLSRLGR